MRTTITVYFLPTVTTIYNMDPLSVTRFIKIFDVVESIKN